MLFPAQLFDHPATAAGQVGGPDQHRCNVEAEDAHRCCKKFQAQRPVFRQDQKQGNGKFAQGYHPADQLGIGSQIGNGCYELLEPIVPGEFEVTGIGEQKYAGHGNGRDQGLSGDGRLAGCFASLLHGAGFGG